MIADNSPGLIAERHTRATYDSKAKYGETLTITRSCRVEAVPRRTPRKSRPPRFWNGFLLFLHNNL